MLPKSLKDKSILFIEDDNDVAKHSILFFQEFVKNVYHVTTTIEADVLLRSHKIDKVNYTKNSSYPH
ncbi:MAG: hypothetical protein ACYDD5_09590, partial [Sulfuricurvum sp.]